MIAATGNDGHSKFMSSDNNLARKQIRGNRKKRMVRKKRVLKTDSKPSTEVKETPDVEMKTCPLRRPENEEGPCDICSG